MSDTHDRGEVLETMLDLGADRQVAAAELAARSGLDAQRVAELLTVLADEGLVRRGEDGARLTDRGEQAAIGFVRKHRLAERMLRDLIGLDWWKIHHEARRWEDVISDEVEQRLVDLLGDPGTCPHGNPIPGSVNRPDQSDAARLADAAPGAYTIVRITEDLEEDDEALQLLEGAGIIPGRLAEVVAHGDDGSVSVVGSLADASLPPHVAERTYVNAIG